MDFFWEIALQTIGILALIIGILGTAFSLLLLISPSTTKKVSHVFNRYIDVDKKISYLDKDIQTESIIYKHHVVAGSCLIIGSGFILIFLMFKLDVTNFVNIFFNSPKYATINEIISSSMAMVGKIVGVAGIIFGFILLLLPGKMKKIERKVNTWLSTQHMISKINETHHDIDTFIYQHALLFGLTGLIISIFLTVLATFNMLHN
ncbi:MAG: hypothetical protein SWH54_11740 [Thermodesulfobacteriota bacterium]|nr:hypothetical protein [Thermodesulfobacteriota bacterium]